MNSKRTVGITLAVVIAAGLGVLANVATNGANAAEQDKKSTTSTVPATPADLVLEPGAAGPVKVGMTKDQALATGLFLADVPGAVDGCPSLPLTWKKTFASALDVQTLPTGEIVAIGVRTPGPSTAGGLGVGSTYGDLRAAYPGAVAVDAGYGQSGVRVQDEATGDWIGFLLDDAPADVTATDEVTFVEVSAGRAPSLMRDGC